MSQVTILFYSILFLVAIIFYSILGNNFILFLVTIIFYSFLAYNSILFLVTFILLGNSYIFDNNFIYTYIVFFLFL